MCFLEGSPERTVTPESVDEPVSTTVADPQCVGHNYMDCTESNDEEEEDDEGEEDQDKAARDTVITEEKESKLEEQMKEENKENCNPPKWEDFFTAEMLSDSQNSQSHSCCSVTSPSRMTGSQTPELFSDEETPDSVENFSLTLSASVSNHSSQNIDLSLPDTLVLLPERGGREPGDEGTSVVPQGEEGDGLLLPSELSGSQASSDFDIPCTPESKVPRPDELLKLYRKLASGQEELI